MALSRTRQQEQPQRVRGHKASGPSEEVTLIGGRAAQEVVSYTLKKTIAITKKRNSKMKKDVEYHVFMNASQYAQYRDVSAARIKKLCSENRLEGAAKKVGRAWEIDVEEADRILSESIDIAWMDQGKLHKPVHSLESVQQEALTNAGTVVGYPTPENFRELCLRYVVELQELEPDLIEVGILEDQSELLVILPFPFEEILSQDDTGEPLPDLGVDFISTGERIR